MASARLRKSASGLAHAGVKNSKAIEKLCALCNCSSHQRDPVCEECDLPPFKECITFHVVTPGKGQILVAGMRWAYNPKLKKGMLEPQGQCCWYCFRALNSSSEYIEKSLNPTKARELVASDPSEKTKLLENRSMVVTIAIKFRGQCNSTLWDTVSHDNVVAENHNRRGRMKTVRKFVAQFGYRPHVKDIKVKKCRRTGKLKEMVKVFKDDS